MKPNVVQIANLTIGAKRANPQRRRVYSPKGIAPTVYCYGGGNQEPLVPVCYESD